MNAFTFYCPSCDRPIFPWHTEVDEWPCKGPACPWPTPTQEDLRRDLLKAKAVKMPNGAQIFLQLRKLPGNGYVIWLGNGAIKFNCDILPMEFGQDAFDYLATLPYEEMSRTFSWLNQLEEERNREYYR